MKSITLKSLFVALPRTIIMVPLLVLLMSASMVSAEIASESFLSAWTPAYSCWTAAGSTRAVDPRFDSTYVYATNADVTWLPGTTPSGPDITMKKYITDNRDDNFWDSKCKGDKYES